MNRIIPSNPRMMSIKRVALDLSFVAGELGGATVGAFSSCSASSGCGSTASKPAADDTQAVTATPPAASSHQFTSQRYGLRVTLGKHWSERDARIDTLGTPGTPPPVPTLSGLLRARTGSVVRRVARLPRRLVRSAGALVGGR